MSILDFLAGANDTNIIRRITRALNGIRAFANWLEERGISRDKVAFLVNQDDDVTFEQVREVIGDMRTNLDDFEAEIEARRAIEGDIENEVDLEGAGPGEDEINQPPPE